MSELQGFECPRCGQLDALSGNGFIYDHNTPDGDECSVPDQPGEDRLTIYLSRNAKMSPNKAAAQAVHAALLHYGIRHGAVICLDASNTKILNECADRTIVFDAGRTELDPGTLTAGVRINKDV